MRKRYALRPGDRLTVADLGGLFVLSPEVSIVSKTARKIEEIRRAAGLSLDALLAGLDAQRRELYRERYGSPA